MNRETRQQQREGRLGPYSKPLPTRVGVKKASDLSDYYDGVSASDFREEPVTNTKIVDGGNFNQLLINENMRLKETNKYLESIIEDLLNEIENIDDLD